MHSKRYVVVHGGAGVHSKNSEAQVKTALRSACTQALSNGSQSDVALCMAESAIASLEDSPLLNAGYGANLTLDGTVECDAAIMNGHKHEFGSVGAASGVKNPIRLARRILEHARVPDPLGRIPPLTLVADGARAFAQSAGVDLVVPTSLVTPRAQAQWATWKARLDGADSPPPPDAESLHAIQDTVGAVAWDAASGAIASGVSSGGILLKCPGRIGEAAVFGAGCWAQAVACGKQGMACSVSGAGEYIIRANLARSVIDAVNRNPRADVDVHEILQRVFIDDFWKPSRSPANPDPSAGIILLTAEEDDEMRPIGRVWCAFTTPSMAIAYASSENPLGKALVLRRPKAEESRSNNHPRIFVTGFSI
ncbi:asparaginase [Mycena galericulata]|nr:asparaginase [Mycena galericulata]